MVASHSRLGWLSLVAIATLFAPRPAAAQTGFPTYREPVPPHERPIVIGTTRDAVGGLNEFGFDLFHTLRDPGGGNQLISPLSITSAFGMAYAGARGETAAEMERVFGFGGGTHEGLGSLIRDLNTPREGRELRVVNRLFADQSFLMKDAFQAVARDQYGAPVESLDFFGNAEGARTRINEWVESQTNNKIRDLLPSGSVGQDTRLVLTNAVYLNSFWKHEFDPSQTYGRAFHRADGTSADIALMHQQRTFRYGDFDGYSALEMPYAGDDLSMVVLLPDAVDGLADLEASYSSARLTDDLAAMSYANVSVAFPKFRFETTAQLTGPLIELGLAAPFDNADFSGISDEEFAISGVFHKTFIDVSESGTEAAAATSIVAVVTDAYSTPEPPKLFVADRGFLFAIRDNHSGAVMFLGRFDDPANGVAPPDRGIRIDFPRLNNPDLFPLVPEPSAGLLALCGAMGVYSRAPRKRSL
jgi:serpin B